MNNDQKKVYARALFIAGSMNRKEIAASVKCTEKTLRKWIVEGSWQKLKDVKSITRKQLLIDAYNQLAQINQSIKENPKLLLDKVTADTRASIRKDIETLEDIPLHRTVEVMEHFTDFLIRKYPDQVKDITKLQLEFIEQLAKN